ncbi:sodium-coupled neutral amino acid transporter 5-like [Alosa sapidissima]|uniref:sodium-coupled neutral amino acid transporter 5-like n=1 Tax=Alosa sapidissima TaxID=34773 RepID=UPI001C087A63|nr:sodium-coupled neutral amino acid transporter 5-like [Alosa sapidissima]XP_041953284.1 sodium-coupled neutral amino acid transporter 5-like [Alosa sapidissima]
MELQKMTNGHHCSDLSPEKIILEDGFEAAEEREEFLPHGTEGGKKVVQFTDFEGKTSFGMSVFNLSNAIMGSGILGLAYAMANTGIVLFIILLTCIAVLSAYSIHLLLRSAGVVGIRAYEQLGNRAFGTPGKVVAALIITMHNIGAMSSYLFIVKSELPLVIQAFVGKENTGEWYMNGNYLIIIVSIVVILPLALMRQIGYLGYTSGFSLSCMMFFLISVIYKKFASECPLDSHSHNITVTEASMGMEFTTHSVLPTAVPTAGLMLTTGGPTEFTTVTDSLTTLLPTDVQNLMENATESLYELINATFTTMSSTDGHMETISDLTTPIIATTLGDLQSLSTSVADGELPMRLISDHEHSVADETCLAKMLTINLQTAYAIPILAFAFVCHPEVLPIYTELREPTKNRMQGVANISIAAMFLMYLLTALFGYLTFYDHVESELLHAYSKTDTLILCVRLAVLMAVTLTVPVVLFPIRRALQQLLFPDKPFQWARHIIIALCVLIVVNILVIFVPNIRDIFGFIGATSAPSLIFILPGIFYLRIIPEEQEPMKSKSKMGAAAFAALGFIFMVMSISFIILDWASGEKRSGGGH